MNQLYNSFQKKVLVNIMMISVSKKTWKPMFLVFFWKILYVSRSNVLQQTLEL